MPSLKSLSFGILPCIAISSLVIPEFKSFYQLSYPVQINNVVKYGNGIKDLCIIFTYTQLLLWIRIIFMKYVHFNVKKEQRLKEQAYQFMIYSISFIYGIYNYQISPLPTSWVYIVHPYPQKYTSWHLKQYYLGIGALWCHMIFVLHMEKKRKDHLMMLVHHFVALSMVITSWYANGALLGILIETIFDSMDIVLCLAKCMKYLHYNKSADLLFGLFVVGWVYTRQYLYVHVILQWWDFSKYNEMKWDPKNGLFVNDWMMFWSKILMVGLLFMVFFWFIMILKLVVKVIKGNNVDDSRSDDEDEKQD
eukprot:NODE_395_length_8134_cov_0.767393.p3 type:complete len:307 gc:universal NODE_395_length_8134_cov_0.767393:7210-6290(-)